MSDNEVVQSDTEIHACDCLPLQNYICQGCQLNIKQARIEQLEKQLDDVTAIANKNMQNKFNKKDSK